MDATIALVKLGVWRHFASPPVYDRKKPIWISALSSSRCSAPREARRGDPRRVDPTELPDPLIFVLGNRSSVRISKIVQVETIGLASRVGAKNGDQDDTEGDAADRHGNIG